MIGREVFHVALMTFNIISFTERSDLDAIFFL